MICACCLESCHERQYNDGYYYEWGSESVWHDESYTGSSCCGAEIYQGRIWLETYSKHKARQDHWSNGNRIIKAGQAYVAELIKGYYVNADGRHVAIYRYRKTPLIQGDH